MSATPTTNEEIRDAIHELCATFYADYTAEHGHVMAKVTEAYMQQIMMIDQLVAALGGAPENVANELHGIIDRFSRYMLAVYFTSLTDGNPDAITEESSSRSFEDARGLIERINALAAGARAGDAAAAAE